MRVVVAQEQPKPLDQFRQTLLGLGLECSLGDCVTFPELPVRLAQGPVDLLLARVAPDSSASLEAIRQAVTLTSAPVLALGPTTDPQHILQTTRSGARDYLDESRLQQDLEAALEKLRLAGAVKYQQGLIVSVASITPGAGVSTLATNLAFSWIDSHPERVALIELGREAADLGISLDLSPRHSVADVTQHWERMDATLLQQSMVAHAAGVRILAQKQDLLSAPPIPPPAVRKLIILMRALYGVGVLDLGHLLEEEHYEAMRLSDVVVVVVRLDVPSLRQARHLVRRCNEQGVPRERLHLVANRYGQKGQIAWKKAEEAVGMPLADYIPEDSGKMNHALNQGQPTVRLSRFGGVTRRFYKLAATLAARRG
jgi:pilus assembly protein CpaE